MERRPLGASGLDVSPISLGAMSFGSGFTKETVIDEDLAARLVDRALDAGVNLIDTADTYGRGASETAIAEALHPYPADLVIATKGGQVARNGAPGADGRPEHLRAACEASLQRLRLDTIPLYQLHNPDPEVPLAESIGALAELQAEGKVRQIGISNVFAEQLDQVLSDFPLVSVQNQYHLLHRRRGDRDIEICEPRGVGFMPYRPLASGTLAAAPDAVAQIAEARGVTRAQVVLAWLLRRSPLMLPIPGTRTVEHLEENVAAASLELTDDEVAALEAWAEAQTNS
jgi:pyridoxine 4-dehydrogenase